MYDFLVAILQASYFIILFTFIPVTLLVRTFIVLKSELPSKKALFVIFDFTSLSYFTLMTNENKAYKIYSRLLIIYGVFAFLAFAFGIHMYF